MSIRLCEPNIVQSVTGWLAATPADHPYRIGVVGDDEAQARRRFEATFRLGTSCTIGPNGRDTGIRLSNDLEGPKVEAQALRRVLRVREARGSSSGCRSVRSMRTRQAERRRQEAEGLGDQFCVGEPSTSDAAEHGLEAFQVGQVAQVEREHALIDVAGQVLRVDLDVGSLESTLEQRPEVLDAVGVTRPRTYSSRGRRRRARTRRASAVALVRVGVERRAGFTFA